MAVPLAMAAFETTAKAIKAYEFMAKSIRE